MSRSNDPNSLRCRRLAHPNLSARLLSLTLVLLTLPLPARCLAGTPRAVPAGELPADSRLQPLKDLNGYFPFDPPASREQWKSRSEQLRRRMLVALGLWPKPSPTPLNPVIHGKIDQGDYTIEKVYFESMPGFFVTGNLYRPKHAKGKSPGVLCPHGHWSEGRFYDAGTAATQKQILQGGERFEDGGRSPLQSRCVQLARMGCVVFHYDMIGYADSTQLSYELAHRFARQRADMNDPQQWGLFSPQAESHLQSVMGLQTWNSMRSLDFLISLPDVDPQRLAATGASGGGTQTFILSALDPRIQVSVPAVMVSTAMQGGCTCENACLLRIGTGNVEFAALFAPKPLCLTAADDWTKEMETKGFPELQEHFKVMGAISHVQLNPFTWFGHNYNYVSRSAMYQWMNQYLRLGLKTPVIEQDYTRLTKAELTVWDDTHPRPDGGEAFERKLLRWWHEDAQQQLEATLPKDRESLSAFRRLVGGGVDAVIGERLPKPKAVEFQPGDVIEIDGYRAQVGLTRNRQHGSELPTLWLLPQDPASKTAIWLHENGKGGLFAADGKLRPPVKQLLDEGVAVLGVDLLYQGEFLEDGQPIKETRRVENPREAAAYTFGYNPSLFARRVHDVLTTVALARDQTDNTNVWLVGLEGAGPWAAAALGQCRGAVGKAAIDTGSFRFGDVRGLHAPEFLPGGARYFDLPGMLSLAAPTPLWLAGEHGVPQVVQNAYAATVPQALTSVPSSVENTAQQAVEWLLK